MALDLVNPPRGPGVNRWIDVSQSPLVGRQLPVRMHVPLTRQQNQLPLGKLRVDEGQGHAFQPD